MTALKALGQWLDCSGWTSVLEIAGSASSGIVNSFVNAGHVIRTRRAHQITAAALYIMQHLAYQKYLCALTEDQQRLQFKEWKEDMSSKHPQFLYWSRVLQLQLIVFQLVRAFRNADFSLYLHSLSQLIPWFHLIISTMPGGCQYISEACVLYRSSILMCIDTLDRGNLLFTKQSMHFSQLR